MDDTNKITIFVKEQSDENVNEKMLSNVNDTITTSSTIQQINHLTNNNNNNNVIIKQVYDNDDSTVGKDAIVSDNHIQCHDGMENNDDDGDENNGEEFDFSSSDLDELTTSENNSESGFVDDANQHSLIITDQFESGTFDVDSTSNFHLTNSFSTSTDEVTSIAATALVNNINNNNTDDDVKINSSELICAKSIEANNSDDKMLLVVVNDIISEAINKCLLLENVDTIDTTTVDSTTVSVGENFVVVGDENHSDVDGAAEGVDGNQSDGQTDQVIVNFLGKSNELVGFFKSFIHKNMFYLFFGYKK